MLALLHGDDDSPDLACGAILLWSVNKSHRHVECDECVSHDSFLFCFFVVVVFLILPMIKDARLSTVCNLAARKRCFTVNI